MYSPNPLVWRFIDQDQQVEEVSSGRADLAWQLTDRVPELTTSHAGQVHLAPDNRGIFDMGLKHATPPFDDVEGAPGTELRGRPWDDRCTLRRTRLPDVPDPPVGLSRVCPVLPLHPYEPGRTCTAPWISPRRRQLISPPGTAGSKVIVLGLSHAFPDIPRGGGEPLLRGPVETSSASTPRYGGTSKRNTTCVLQSLAGGTDGGRCMEHRLHR